MILKLLPVGQPARAHERQGVGSRRAWLPHLPDNRSIGGTRSAQHHLPGHHCFDHFDVIWTGDGVPQRLRGNHGTAFTFDVMGVPLLIGRTLTPAAAAPDATRPTCWLQLLARPFLRRSRRAWPRMRINGMVRRRSA